MFDPEATRRVGPRSSGASTLFAALVAVLALGGCDADEELDLAKAALTMSARWDCCGPGTAPGYAVRVHLGLPGAEQSSAAADCPQLPSGLTIEMNGQSATILDRGGAELGGEAGTEFVRCRTEGFAEAGPLLTFPDNRVSVRVRLGSQSAEAIFDKILPGRVPGGEARIALPIDGRVRLGDEVVVTGMGTEPSGRKHSLAEIYFEDGQLPRSRASLVNLGGDGLHLRAQGRPGKATLVVHFEATSLDKNGGGYPIADASCVGLLSCTGFDAQTLGPFPLELVAP